RSSSPTAAARRRRPRAARRSSAGGRRRASATFTPGGVNRCSRLRLGLLDFDGYRGLGRAAWLARGVLFGFGMRNMLRNLFSVGLRSALAGGTLLCFSAGARGEEAAPAPGL